MTLEEFSTEINAERCAAEVVEIIPLVLGFIRAQMRNQGEPFLSISQFRSLMFLYRYPNSSLSKLATYLGVTRPTASAICDRLVQESLVYRTQDPLERRAVELKLTPTGGARLDEIRSIASTKISPMFSDLSEDEMRIMLDGLAILSKVFDSNSNPS